MIIIAFMFCSCEKSDTPISPTPPVKTITDIDDNVYNTVQIGTQEWMAENLMVTHYRNGDEIPNVTTGWSDTTTGAYCNYNNNLNNAIIMVDCTQLVCGRRPSVD